MKVTQSSTEHIHNLLAMLIKARKPLSASEIATEKCKPTLRQAAEALVKRPISDEEIDILWNQYEAAKGTPYGRAISVLRKFAGI